MKDLPTVDDFRNAYIEMDAALIEKRRNDTFCDDCLKSGFLSLFPRSAHRKRWNNNPYVSYNYESVLDLAKRVLCPLCRLLWRFLRKGNDTCCEDLCREVVRTLQHIPFDLSKSTALDDFHDFEVTIDFDLQEESQTGFVTLELPSQTVCRHIAHGDLHLVHPTQADPFRIKYWISRCESAHETCNERFINDQNSSKETSSLFGYSEASLRLIDVESRRIVQSSHPVRYLALSYVWGNAASRIFANIENPNWEDACFPLDIKPLKKQPKALVNRCLPRTFEDAISFTQRLGQRYLWIDTLCIPQDQPIIKAQQISKMDQIYSEGLCTLVSLTYGVENGLLGASSDTERHFEQSIEHMPNGYKFSAYLLSPCAMVEKTAWATRAWTLQEYLLSRRSIFFGEHQTFFICKEMVARESWTWPHSTEFIRGNVTEDWSKFELPLGIGKSADGLTETYKKVVSMYTNRNLTFFSDRHRAFEGIQARLSQTYNVHFLHGIPLSDNLFLEALLWNNQRQDRVFLGCLESLSSNTGKWPSWSWFGNPGGVSYLEYPWAPKEEFANNLHLPKPEVFFQATENQFSLLSSSPIQSDFGYLTVLKLRVLALDIDFAEWQDHCPNWFPSLEIWRNYNFMTARGPISFHLGILSDQQENTGSPFPDGTQFIRLLCLNESDRPKIAWKHSNQSKLTFRSPQSWNSTSCEETQTSKRETTFSSSLDWHEPQAISRADGDFVPDARLLIVQTKEAGEVARRLGVALVRMVDFIVGGATLTEVLLQ